MVDLVRSKSKHVTPKMILVSDKGQDTLEDEDETAVMLEIEKKGVHLHQKSDLIQSSNFSARYLKQAKQLNKFNNA